LNLPEHSYNIYVGQNILDSAGEILALDRKVFILTDDGVPPQYAKEVANQCKNAKIHTVCQGEGAKSFAVLQAALSEMLKFEMTRGDCVVAVGGGVVGDLCAFAAATYMRGIDFYNVPTTLLAAVDSSIGGKCAVNLDGVKNIVGTFYQPKAVLIDTNTLKTLEERQISAGLAESVKMALTSDKELFEIFEKKNPMEYIEEIIIRSLKIKKAVVEEDERESGLRKILNFGHTIGHAIEAEENGKLYHGECVALGMIPMCKKDVRSRLIPVLNKINLKTDYDGNLDSALKFISHDKKRAGDLIDAVYVDKVGEYRIEKTSPSEITLLAKETL